MMTAFYQDPQWASFWHGKSLDAIIFDCAQRLPLNLSNGRDFKSHQKIVERKTGEIVGYARWILPEESTDDWLDAVVPEVSDEATYQMYQNMFESMT